MAPASLPLSNTPSFIHLGLAEKQLFSGSGVTGAAYLGIAYEELGYEYNQAFPHHIKTEMLPLITTGLRVKF